MTHSVIVCMRPPWGEVECFPVPRDDHPIQRYTYPGGRLYTYEQLAHMASSYRWKLKEGRRIVQGRHDMTDGRLVRANDRGNVAREETAI